MDASVTRRRGGSPDCLFGIKTIWTKQSCDPSHTSGPARRSKKQRLRRRSGRSTSVNDGSFPPRRRSISSSTAFAGKRAYQRCAAAKASPPICTTVGPRTSWRPERRLQGDTARKSTMHEVIELRKENLRLKAATDELLLEIRTLKKVSWDPNRRKRIHETLGG